ncbi:hypothetical protein CLF_103106, partial [Clonorchis sinensis]
MEKADESPQHRNGGTVQPACGAAAHFFGEYQRVLVRDYSGIHPTRLPGHIFRRHNKVLWGIQVGPSRFQAFVELPGWEVLTSGSIDRNNQESNWVIIGDVAQTNFIAQARTPSYILRRDNLDCRSIYRATSNELHNTALFTKVDPEDKRCSVHEPTLIRVQVQSDKRKRFYWCIFEKTFALRLRQTNRGSQLEDGSGQCAHTSCFTAVLDFSERDSWSTEINRGTSPQKRSELRSTFIKQSTNRSEPMDFNKRMAIINPRRQHNKQLGRSRHPFRNNDKPKAKRSMIRIRENTTFQLHNYHLNTINSLQSDQLVNYTRKAQVSAFISYRKLNGAHRYVSRKRRNGKISQLEYGVGFSHLLLVSNPRATRLKFLQYFKTSQPNMKTRISWELRRLSNMGSVGKQCLDEPRFDMGVLHRMFGVHKSDTDRSTPKLVISLCSALYKHSGT